LMRPESLFRSETGTTLRLRLALDGSTVFGVLMVAGQVDGALTLKVDETRKAAVDISTERFAAHIKSMLTKNSQWRGTLRDIRESRSAEVTMKVTDVNPADGIA